MGTLGLPKKESENVSDGTEVKESLGKNTEIDDLKAQIAVLMKKISVDEEKKVEVKPEVQMIDLHLKLSPGSGGAINHAGKMYVNGFSYKVSSDVANDLLEIQNRGWSHESSLQNPDNMGRKKLSQRIG